MIDFIKMVLLPIAAFICLFAFVSDRYLNYQCNNYQQLTGKTTRHVRLDACYIKTEKGFQRWDEYKIRAAASEGLLNDLRH